MKHTTIRKIQKQFKCRDVFPLYLMLTLIFGMIADVYNREADSLFGQLFIHLFMFANGN